MSLDNMQKETGRQLKEDGHYINRADALDRGTNFFNDFKVAQNITQFALNNNLPLSTFRDKQVGNVSKQGSEYRVRADASNNTSILRTALRGNYESGSTLNPGIGLRVPTLPTGSQFVEWGYYDYDVSNNPNNGISFKRISGDFVLNLYKNGSNQIGGGSGVPQADWNIDKMDGTGPSGANISVPNGYVYNLPFVYYGYGPLFFFVGVVDNQGTHRLFPIHVADIDEETSIEEPNLPLTVTCYNGGDSSTIDAYVGGRQVSTSGTDKTVEPRIVGSEVRSKSVGTTLTPLIAFQHKSGRENIRVKLSDFWVQTDVSLHLYLYRMITLTGGTTTFSSPFGYTANETACEFNGNATSNNGATGFTGGERFGGNRYVADTSVAAGSVADVFTLPQSVLIEGETWALVAQTSSGTATVTAGLNLAEEW